MRFLLVILLVALLLATTVGAVSAAGGSFATLNGKASGSVEVTADGSGCVTVAGALSVDDGGIEYEDSYSTCD